MHSSNNMIATSKVSMRPMMVGAFLSVATKRVGLRQLQAGVSSKAVVLTDCSVYLDVREETEAKLLRFPNGD